MTNLKNEILTDLRRELLQVETKLQELNDMAKKPIHLRNLSLKEIGNQIIECSSRVPEIISEIKKTESLPPCQE